MCAKVAFLQAGSCWGCNQSLLNSHLTLLSVLPELEIVYWPAVVDFKIHDFEQRPDQSVDVGFIEGFVRTQQDHHNVNTMRKKCKIIVALGSCAVQGSVGGMANLYSIEDLVKRKFEDEEFVDKGSKLPNQHVPKILDHIPDLHTVIKVDVDLPGCPPVPGNIIGLIATVLQSIEFKADQTKSMCEICPLKTCLLNEDKICYGPICAAGLNNVKLKNGYADLGEYGLTHQINADNAAKLLKKLTAKPLSKPEVQQVVEALLLLLQGPVALGYLDGRVDLIRQTKLAPNKLKIKKIDHPTDLDKKVDVVDFKLEGYAPMLCDIIGASLMELRNNPEYDQSAATICSSCPRNLEDKAVDHYKRDYEGLPDYKTCLLNQGYVCFGPITKAGCGTLCPKANTPCEGCYGPAWNVDDYAAKALSYFPSICKDTPENIKAFFKDPAGLFGRFTTVVSKLGYYSKEKGGHE
jgi:coenzyme F420-reducing hydrogenase gamma subunit